MFTDMDAFLFTNWTLQCLQSNNHYVEVCHGNSSWDYLSEDNLQDVLIADETKNIGQQLYNWLNVNRQEFKIDKNRHKFSQIF